MSPYNGKRGFKQKPNPPTPHKKKPKTKTHLWEERPEREKKKKAMWATWMADRGIPAVLLSWPARTGEPHGLRSTVTRLPEREERHWVLLILKYRERKTAEALAQICLGKGGLGSGGKVSNASQIRLYRLATGKKKENASRRPSVPRLIAEEQIQIRIKLYDRMLKICF